MQIFLGSDHGGFALKEFLKEKLGRTHKVRDFGCGGESCDYPDFAEKVARAVAESNGKAVGILSCGTGIGMCIAANKFAGIRAAVVWDEFSAKMAREHNNANVICLGGRVLEKEQALHLAKIFLESSFQGNRHARRVAKITSLDRARCDPSPVVAAMIFNGKNELFLIKNVKWGGLYGIPGGHVEKGEKMEEALKREIREETNLEIYDLKLFKVVDAVYPKEFRGKRHFVFIDYLAKAKGKVKLDPGEASSCVWVEPKRALKELKMDEFTRKNVEDWVKITGLVQVR
jgi:ribose 5-phosphate isomerase B